MFASLPRFPLAHLPTPLEYLPRLSAALGPRLWIKRDDQTGLAGGGNKTRKLEFLTADAQAQNADTLITIGAPQSNHARQTAAAAAKAGLRSILVLSGFAPAHRAGNILLDDLLGAQIIWTGNRPREEVMEEVAAEERAAGRRPYVIPLGGSNVLGATGYANAMLELHMQMRAQDVSFNRIVFASSSAGTHAGLVVGKQLIDFAGEVLGISVDHPAEKLTAMVAQLATETATFLGEPHEYTPADIHVNSNYLGGGYAVMGQAEREAIQLFAEKEAVLVDPVYTGRAAAGLIDLIRRGAIGKDETVLFWHTGGTPALWAYTKQLTNDEGANDEG